MNQEIDPFTGLPLKAIGPTAPQRSANIFQTPTDPLGARVDTTQKVATPTLSSPDATLPKTSVVDGILFGLLGAPDSDLPPEKLAERRQRRANAQAAATSAAENPGESYMQIGGNAGAGGSSALESLGKIVRLFAGGGGG